MELNAPRLRFNHGFWDGRNAAQARRRPLWTSPHFDSVYEAGHEAGKASASEVVLESSDPAWKAHKASQAQAKADRKILREMRPAPSRRF